MTVFDRLGPVVVIPAKKEGEGADAKLVYDETTAKALKKSTVLHKAEQFSPADLQVIATQTKAVVDSEVWSDPSVGSEAEMLTPPNLTSPETSLPVTIAEVPEEATPDWADDEENS